MNNGSPWVTPSLLYNIVEDPLLSNGAQPREVLKKKREHLGHRIHAFHRTAALLIELDALDASIISTPYPLTLYSIIYSMNHSFNTKSYPSA